MCLCEYEYLKPGNWLILCLNRWSHLGNGIDMYWPVVPYRQVSIASYFQFSVLNIAGKLMLKFSVSTLLKTILFFCNLYFLLGVTDHVEDRVRITTFFK
jgi:hypothetical protein